jgi:hypothetical protein
MKQIGFAEDTNDAPLIVDDRKSAYVVINQELQRFRDVFVWANSHNILDHHITGIHVDFLCKFEIRRLHRGSLEASIALGSQCQSLALGIAPPV